MILLPLIFPVIVGDIFDETCGQQFTRPGTTSGGTRASVAPWTISLGSLFSRFIFSCKSDPRDSIVC